jgi:CubicO group peptidase (beta-lactamase class C family)
MGVTRVRRSPGGGRPCPAAAVLLLLLGTALLGAALLPACASGERGIPEPRATPFPNAAPEAVGMSAERLRAAVDTVGRWVDEGRIVGAEMLVIRHGRVVLHEAVGWDDRERGIPLQTDRILRMRSMTKPLAGTAVLMLMEEGRLALEDRVATYLPAWDNPRAREITIFQLLTHTSGLQGGILAREGYPTMRAAIDAVGSRGPVNPPGTAYHYTDAGSSALGAIVEAITAEAPEAFIQRRILTPLGMRDSYLHDVPAGDPRLTRTVATYQGAGEGWEKYWDPSMPRSMPYFGGGAGGLYATALDYARLLSMMLNGGELHGVRLLRPATVSLALQPHSAYVHSDREKRETTRFYGLQWYVETDRFAPHPGPMSSRAFGHGGSDGTYAWADPEHGLVALFLTQSRGTDRRPHFVPLVYAALVDRD